MGVSLLLRNIRSMFPDEANPLFAWVPATSPSWSIRNWSLVHWWTIGRCLQSTIPVLKPSLGKRNKDFLSMCRMPFFTTVPTLSDYPLALTPLLGRSLSVSSHNSICPQGWSISWNPVLKLPDQINMYHHACTNKLCVLCIYDKLLLLLAD